MRLRITLFFPCFEAEGNIDLIAHGKWGVQWRKVHHYPALFVSLAITIQPACDYSLNFRYKAFVREVNPIKKRMGNLVGGNKISITHLQQTEGNYADAIRDFNSVRFTNFSYGLLPLAKVKNHHVIWKSKKKIEIK